MSKYEVKGVKFHRGHEGEPLAQCTLYRDGKKVALYSDGDWGGEAQIDWLDCKAPRIEVKGIRYGGEAFSYNGTPEEALLTAHCAAIAPQPCEWGDHKPVYTTPDIFIGELVSVWESANRLQKAAKTKTLFILKQKGREVEYAMNCPYTPEIKAHLEAEHGADLVRILNTEFVGAADAEAIAKKKAEKRMRSQCKTKTLFRLEGDKEGKYWVIASPYSPMLKMRLESKYGAKLVEIINETLGVMAA